MKLSEVPIEKIKIGERFRADLGDLHSLIESIKEKGIIQPITLDENYILLAGGRRLAAAREVGLKAVPAIFRKSKNELDSREIELIENIARKDMTWAERSKLEQRIFALKESQDPNWSLSKQGEILGRSKSNAHRSLELARAIETVPELAECRTEDEAWKKWQRLQEEAVIHAMVEKQRGGQAAQQTIDATYHYLIGDALEGLRTAADSTIGFAEVDPPYAIMLDKRRSRNKDQDTADRYNEIDAENYPAFIRSVATEVYRVLNEPTFCVWWFGFEWYQTVREILDGVGFKVSSVPAIWVKGGAGQTASPDTMLGSMYECFFVCRKGNPALRKVGRGNVFSYLQVPAARKIHATERPIELMSEILDTFVYPGMRILVPFLGSGVTLRAAYKKGLLGYGFDLDETIKRRFLVKVEEDQTNGRETMDGTEERLQDGDDVPE